MAIRVLGTLEVLDEGGVVVDIRGPQPRIVLAMLLAADGKEVGVDALVDAIWDDRPPASAAGTLHSYISRLRRAVEAVGGSIVREPAGYRLEIDRDAIDVHRFEALAAEGRRALERGEHAAGHELLVQAEQLWRGPALLDVRDRQRLAGFARRLDEQRLAVIEDRVAAELALGRHATAVAELAQLVGEHPLREGLWQLLALARYRAGMQADALRAIAEARSTLVEELGVEPGAGLRELEQAILAHDPALDLDPDLLVVPADDGADERPATAATRAAAPASARPEPPAESGPPLVGRTEELAALVGALDGAFVGGAGVAVVEGEPGVGKTRLVEELAAVAEARGARVLWGRALEGGAAPAYWPWLGVLRALRASAPERADAAVDQLLDVRGPATEGAAVAEGAHLLEGVLRLVEPGPDDAPLVVVLEDVQWADGESLDLARDVVAGMAAGPVLLVLTLRESEEAERDGVVALLAAVARRSGRRLRLQGLPPDDTAALLAQVSGAPVDEGLARLVHERADGNPFYAIELQRLLDAEGLADASAAGARAVPAGVRDVVRQRLARLPESTLELLQLAAVAGRDLDLDVLSVASGRPLDECLDDLDVALSHRVLTEGGSVAGLRFSHALVREVVVDELRPLRRARAHLAVADAILSRRDDEETAEIVAEHLWAAAPIGVGRRAADALDRAADVAIQRFSLGAASDLLARSLELRRSIGSSPEDEAAELATLLQQVWVLTARHGYRGALALYPRGAELGRRLRRDDVVLAMEWAEWASHAAGCDLDRARPFAERFRSWAEESDDPLVRLAGTSTWGIQCWHDGDLRASAAALEQAAVARTDVAQQDEISSSAAEFVLMSTCFELTVREQVGALDGPEQAFTAAADTFPGQLPAAIVWTFASSGAASVGDLSRLERSSRRVLEAAGGEALGLYGNQGRMYLGAVLTATGRADEGRPLFEEGFESYLESGMGSGLGLMLAVACSAEVLAGDLDRATLHLERARTELARGERWPAPYVLLAEADLAEARGASAAALEQLRGDAVAAAQERGVAAAEVRARAALDGERWLIVEPQSPGVGADPSASSPSSA